MKTKLLLSFISITIASLLHGEAINQNELKSALSKGITFSKDYKVLRRCPQDVTSVAIPNGVEKNCC